MIANTSTSRLLLNGLALACLAVALAGCGGGGSSGGTPPAASPPPSPPPPTGSGGSPALADNSPGSKARFDNFGTRPVTVPVEQHAFSGRHVFVKVSREDGQVLFLGEVAPSLPFTVSVQLPVGSTRVDYQIFSESGTDEIVFGEIAL